MFDIFDAVFLDSHRMGDDEDHQSAGKGSIDIGSRGVHPRKQPDPVHAQDIYQQCADEREIGPSMLAHDQDLEKVLSAHRDHL